MACTLHRLPDAAAFLTEAGPMLEAAEAENNLMIGLANRLLDDADAEGLPYYAVIRAEGEVIAAALRTSPPRHMLLTHTPAAALEPLVDDVLDLELAGFNGPVETTRAFASLWSQRTGNTTSVRFELRIYQLHTVEPVPQPPGRFRVATEADTDAMVPFAAGFMAAVGDIEDPQSSTERRIANRSLFLWEDGEPVSCAHFSGPTPNGIRVSLVYTPPEHRRKGYATACVAALSQHLLDSGRRFCFLFTDLANPTSNSIYQKVGYRPVCDYVDMQCDT